MSIQCFKCKKTANIEINILKYCNECFSRLFETKIQKRIPKVHSTDSIFVFLEDSPFSFVILDFICKNFQNRPISKIEISCTNKQILQKYKTLKFNESEFEIKPETNFLKQKKEIVKYASEHGFQYLFYGNTLNSILLSSLSCLCSGNPEEAIQCTIDESSSDVKIVNIFADIKNKEIMYYNYLRNVTSSYCLKEETKIDIILSNFLYEMDEKNTLTFFNIKNTFTKLFEDK